MWLKLGKNSFLRRTALIGLASATEPRLWRKGQAACEHTAEISTCVLSTTHIPHLRLRRMQLHVSTFYLPCIREQASKHYDEIGRCSAKSLVLLFFSIRPWKTLGARSHLCGIDSREIRALPLLGKPSNAGQQYHEVQIREVKQTSRSGPFSLTYRRKERCAETRGTRTRFYGATAKLRRAHRARGPDPPPFLESQS